MTQRIIVAYGGVSPEREVSIRSGQAVAQAAKEAGYTVEELLINTREDIKKVTSDALVLPILHGAYGEDGQIQAQLEEMAVKFLGSDSTASNSCFDKSLTRELLVKNGLPVAAGEVVSEDTYRSSRYYAQPHVLKATRGGSSIGTYIVRDPSAIDQSRVDEVFQLDDRAVLEELVDGIELTVPILGSTALPAIEIRPPENSDFDFDNKYNGKTEEICPPTSIGDEVMREVQSLAESVHDLLGCRHLSRVDIMLNQLGSPVILEINTMPGLTTQSLYPKSALAAGMTMADLVKEFVRMAEGEKR